MLALYDDLTGNLIMSEEENDWMPDVVVMGYSVDLEINDWLDKRFCILHQILHLLLLYEYAHKPHMTTPPNTHE